MIKKLYLSVYTNWYD